MSPHIMSSQWISHTPNTSILLVCCYPFGSRMAKSLPPEPNSSISVGKSKVGSMIVGRMAPLAMDWLKKCWHLWQNFPANLVAAILTGIARWAMPILAKTVKLLESEEIERNRTPMEMQNLKDGHIGYLTLYDHRRYSLKDTDCLVEDGYFGEHLSGFEHAEMDMMHLEEEAISELCLMSPSIFLDFRNYCEVSTIEDLVMEDMESPGDFSRKWLEDCYHPQIGFKMDGHFGKSLQSDCSHHEELKDFEEGLWQSMESTSISQEEEGKILSVDLAVCEEQSLVSSFGAPSMDKQLEMNKEGGAEDAHNLESTTAPHGFKSSLVLSLFYSPSEEEGDEEDDSEEWWSEDEMEMSTSLGMSSDGTDSTSVPSLEAEDDLLQRNVLENLCGSFSMNKDPFHPLSFSQPIQAPKASSSSPREPKNHQEITVSFYLTRQDSKPGQLCGPSKQPWPRKDPRATYKSSAHKCCQPHSRKNCDSVTSETSFISQKENQVIKKYRHPFLCILRFDSHL
ncbi:protein phosphatase 1 regulatory subunit 15A isoform X2 [Sceloporus undulatus]|uniref:protein phosphatase 1 regulatory subunit 15A isoform X2 n=1 Tax=Sceloporus undulatus TaxID=8520 RepID=UPI001C4C2648|nr:protein phosphatase 1 regulatory subunit 15A isoform X2 [Sceloporus undulatus]